MSDVKVDIDIVIADISQICDYIDDVLPNGKASRYAHMYLGRYLHKRNTFIDMAHPDYIKWERMVKHES